MQHKRTYFLFVLSGLFLVLGCGLWLGTATPANAQCGSQASSCKNCHEVQAQKSVNNDGTGWHKSHAFGDFCYICHAGNQQAVDKAGAHTGMVAPLSDIKASCQQCHPKDLDARAQVYAAKLGVTLGEAASLSASGNAVTTTQSKSSAPASPQTVASTPANTVLDVNDPNLVDYVRNYDEIVLGKKSIDWGNTILIVLILLVLIGGGILVITHEKLVKVSFGDTKTVDGEYPSDVVDLLPAITMLKSSGRKSLKNVLEHPEKAEKILSLMDEVTAAACTTKAGVLTGKTKE